MEAAKYLHGGRSHIGTGVNSAYKRNEASRDELDAAWEMRKSAFENLKHLEQAAQDERRP